MSAIDFWVSIKNQKDPFNFLPFLKMLTTHARVKVYVTKDCNFWLGYTICT